MVVSQSSVRSVVAGRYELDGELGRGGMAEVRAGTDTRLGRPVAVKFLLPEMAARPDIRRRFEAEARAAASLSHPNAVAVYDTGEHDGVPYIVMERLPGETLAHRIAAGPVEPDWLRTVACEVLAALACAHSTGLVHRDVKPGNILLTADGHAKIADFGIAKSLEGSTGDLDLTGTGQLLGTPEYLAPERIEGAPATVRSDLYSLGVVLYEALAGARPFPGSTPLVVIRAAVAGDCRPLRELRPDLDPALLATVERAMAVDPERRFASADEMATALSGDGSVLAGAPTIVGIPAGGATTTVLDREAVAPTVLAAPGRRIPVAALLVALAFVALLVAGLRAGHRPSTVAPTGSSPATTVTTAAPPPTTTGAPPTVRTPPQPAVSTPVTAVAPGHSDEGPGKGEGKGKDKDK